MLFRSIERYYGAAGTSVEFEGETITEETIEHYFVIQQAKYLGVAPWELIEQHPIWRVWATQCIEFDNIPEEKKAKWRST